MLAVEVTPHKDVQASTGAAAGLLRQLQRDAFGGDDIVATDNAVFFDAENVLEIDAADGNKGRSGIRRRAAEFGVEGGQKLLAQIAIGRRDGADAGDAPFVHEAILQGAIDALAAPAGGRRVSEDVFDPEPGERAAHLGEAAAIGRAAGARGMRGPMGAIGVQRHRHAVRPHHSVQGTHDGGDAFAAVPQLGVQDALGRIIHDDDEGEPVLGPQGEPTMTAAIEVQQLPEARARLAPAAMPTRARRLATRPAVCKAFLTKA